MKLLKLFIENFCCFSKTFLDFNDIKSALIIGKVINNDLYSNGVGKTTIFKAIEYALFNQSDTSLDKIIQDDKDSCQIILDVEEDSIVYRIIRLEIKKVYLIYLFIKELQSQQ